MIFPFSEEGTYFYSQHKNKKRLLKLVIITSALLIIFITGCIKTILYDGCLGWNSPNFYLEITNVSTNVLLFKSKISLGDRFLINYTHSLTNRPIEEIFEIDKKGNIILCETFFDSLGFGGPQPQEKDHWIFINNKIKIYNIQRPIGQLLLRVSYLNDHFFFLNSGKESINFRMVANRGDLIRIKICGD